VFLDASQPISAHVLEQSKPPEYLARQIAKAREITTDPHVAKLNEHYALVIVGDKTAILKTSDDGIKFWTLSAFEQWHANQFIHNSRNKKVPLAKYWMCHPQRRQYEGVVFAPGRDVPNHFNLWRGFAVQPRPGDCSRFLAHLRDNVCCGDEELYRGVVGWFANIVQHPERKIGTSLVLRGKIARGARLSMARRPGRSGIAVVHLVRNVLIGLVGEQQGRADADRRAGTDVESDRERGMICREQPGRDERRWSACNDRGELIADRGTAVAQPRRERLRDQRGFPGRTLSSPE
jgi:hypothetical protein